MIVNYPDTFAYLEIHYSDQYVIPWGTGRANYYALPGAPASWFDGRVFAFENLQSEDQAYDLYHNAYEQCLAVPTDVSIQLGGSELDPNTHTYRVTARVALDSDGTSKTVRVYILHALDHYPPNDIQYRFCLRPPAPTHSPWWVADVPLAPGQRVDVEQDFTFDTVSWAHQSDIAIVAWAQPPVSNGSSGQGAFWNSRLMTWPFAPLYERGDLNCDGVINFDDIDPFVLALSDPANYQAAYPYCDLLNADCNGDGAVDFDDIDAFVALLSGG
jgi:hypothetical protein